MSTLTNHHTTHTTTRIPPGWMFLAAVAASWVVLIAAWLVFSAVARQVGAL